MAAAGEGLSCGLGVSPQQVSCHTVHLHAAVPGKGVNIHLRNLCALVPLLLGISFLSCEMGMGHSSTRILRLWGYTVSYNWY